MNVSSTIECFKRYAEEEKRILSELPWDKIEETFEVIRNAAIKDKHIFIVGSGGSAANSSHMAMEFGKNIPHNFGRVKVMSLNDNVAWITAIGDDFSFDDIFLNPLEKLFIRGDILIALSSNEKSRNILKPVEFAKRQNMRTISITGYLLNELRQMVDIGIVIPSYDAGHIENMQQIICHMIVDVFQKWHQYITVENTK